MQVTGLSSSHREKKITSEIHGVSARLFCTMSKQPVRQSVWTTVWACCSRNRQRLFMGGAVFLLINMLYQSLRLPLTKHLYSAHSGVDPDSWSQFLSSTTKYDTVPSGEYNVIPDKHLEQFDRTGPLHHKLSADRIQSPTKNIPLAGRNTLKRIPLRMIGENRKGFDNNHSSSALSGVILDFDSHPKSEIVQDRIHGVSVTRTPTEVGRPSDAERRFVNRDRVPVLEKTGEHGIRTSRRSVGTYNIGVQESRGQRVIQRQLSSDRQFFKPSVFEGTRSETERQPLGRAGAGAQFRLGKRVIHTKRESLARDGVAVQEATRKRVVQRPQSSGRLFLARRPPEEPSEELYFIQKPGARAGDGYWIPSAFKPRVKGRSLEILQDIVGTFVGAMQQAGVQFFLYSGSLLGSWRHHGLVPWDDDVDFVAASRDQQKVYRALMDQRPQYMLDVRQKVRWKFFSSRSHPIQPVPWSWPFLDISFYLENDTHIWDQDPVFPAFCYPKADVFPVQGRPFMGRMLPAPKNAEAVLKHNYNLSLCKLGSYNHQKESVMEAKSLSSVSCSRLVRVFPFVQRVGVPGAGCNETLVQFGEVISWTFLPHVTC